MDNANVIYKKLLHDAGLKATPVRIAILSVMTLFKKPCSVKKIQTKIKNADSTTIYRSMNVFVKKGIVRKVHICGDRNFFELTALPHHHHIICKKCGLIEDFDDCNLVKIIKDIENKSKKFNNINEHIFELFGICCKCDN